MSFDTLGLAPVLLNAIQKAGFTQPTSVQASAIPMALEGQDLIVTAQTGSGKTAAFMLPALNRMATQPADKGVGVQMLVLTPTRELALQVAEAAKLYSMGMKDLRIATVVGGMPYGAQIKALSRRVDILVATPGRLIDHLNARRVNLSKIHSLVLDEADRMLDMGFIDDIEAIVAQTPASRQTLMFSATFEGSVARLAEEMLNNPQRISIADQKQKHTNIKQTLLYADDHGHKFRLLDHLLRDAELDQAIIFTATKRGADDLAERLEDQGFSAMALHGDMNQRQRTRTLNQLQRGRIQILVATDVAARGIDVQGISHAINYDLPMQAEDYVHRIGRTGRAGRNGLAFTLATHSERFKVRRIENFIGQTIDTDVIPGLEPTPKSDASRGKSKGKPRHARNEARSGYAARKGGDRFEKGDRRERNGDRNSYGDRQQSADRAPREDRGYRADNFARDERTPRGEQGNPYAAPSTRGFQKERFAYDNRPARQESEQRSSAPRRAERSQSDWSLDSFVERPKFAASDRPRRGDSRTDGRSEGFKRSDKPAASKGKFGSDKPVRRSRPSTRGDSAPVKSGAPSRAKRPARTWA